MPFEHRTWRIGGLDSNEARDNLRDALSEMDSITNVNVDILEKKANFSFDPNAINENFIKNTINTLGYSFQGDLSL